MYETKERGSSLRTFGPDLCGVVGVAGGSVQRELSVSDKSRYGVG